VPRGRILAFSIDLLRRIENILALSCESVMRSGNALSHFLYVTGGKRRSHARYYTITTEKSSIPRA